MDLIGLIRKKCELLKNSDHFAGIESVLKHIIVAEKHLKNGKDGDDDFFNDAIYRSNQAFEGLLKEAYRVLAGQDPERKTPNDIEKYFETSKTLKPRVLDLFSNYRKEWRNKSTHDYKLFFSDQEAFLAIVNICAFFNIMLDQVVEHTAFLDEKEKLKSNPSLVPKKAKNLDFTRLVVNLLTDFSKDIFIELSGTVQPSFNERQIVGRFVAYLTSVDPDIKISLEHSFGAADKRYYADALLEKNDQRIIVEFKMPSMELNRRIREGSEKLMLYLEAAKIQNGILYMPPRSPEQKIVVLQEVMVAKGVPYTVHKITPMQPAKAKE
jgi:hypothetical protein